MKRLMKTMQILTVCAALAVPMVASANGSLIAPDALTAAQQQELSKAIAAARVQHPEAFERVAMLRARVRGLDGARRGRLAPLTPQLASLGVDALMPLLERIAVTDEAQGDLPASAWTAWRAALLEAVARLESPAAAPVLHAVFASDIADPVVLRASVEAVARLGSDQSVAQLTERLGRPGADRDVVVSAAGYCRRPEMAKLLTHELLTAEGRRVKTVARALADLGNAWGWRLETKARKVHEADVRRSASKALLGAYLAHTGEARQAASNALMVIAWPEVLPQVQAAIEAADGDTLVALQRLETRLARNPVARRGR
ncbi:MAG: hypothetical protein ACI9WU_004590 [Myxococcota bacterium]|jgi:hypothetical protein